MNRERSNLSPIRGGQTDGKFISGKVQEGNYRSCSILGTEVRVWGAEGTSALSHEVIAALRPLIKRVRPTMPIALMADFHPAEFGVVGSVIVSDQLIVPDVIGGDCGCGVYAMRTRITAAELNREQLQRLFREILKSIPVGSAHNSEVGEHLQELPLWARLQSTPFVSSHDLRKLRYQIGSLGSGNHFIELASDEESYLWLLIHSGSRYLGGLLKAYYQGKALQIGTDEASEFLHAQQVVIEFAKRSRQEMADRVVQCMNQIYQFDHTRGDQQIDLAHNFIELNSQSGKTIAIHRKGACAAKQGQYGVIPGSMGTGSFIVEGRGSAPSYSSSSHGSGRLLSRGEAFRKLSTRELIRDMKDVIWSGSERLKDEAPRAYKDLDRVMHAQRDLVRVRHRLKPILSVKGEV